MRTTILFIILLILLPLCVGVQDLLPELPPSSERILLLPVLFCFGALALPLIPALFFALITALVQGLILVRIESGQMEFGLVVPIVFFLGWAFLLQMASEVTHGMRWELHALGSALVTLSLLAGEFLMLCFKRGGFPLDMNVLLRMAVPAGLALLIAPLFYLLLVTLVPFAPAAALGVPRKPGLDS